MENIYCLIIILIAIMLFLRYTTLLEYYDSSLPPMQGVVKSYLDNKGPVRGMLAFWDGEIQNIPYGWVLCDGRVDRYGIPTPKFNDKYIRGASSTQTEPLVYGGSPSVKLTEENLPQHNHGGITSSVIPFSQYDTGGGTNPGGNNQNKNRIHADDSTSGRNEFPSDIKWMTHKHTIKSEGNGRPIQLDPLYREIHVIMKE